MDVNLRVFSFMAVVLMLGLVGLNTASNSSESNFVGKAHGEFEGLELVEYNEFIHMSYDEKIKYIEVSAPSGLEACEMRGTNCLRIELWDENNWIETEIPCSAYIGNSWKDLSLSYVLDMKEKVEEKNMNDFYYRAVCSTFLN